MKLVRSPYFLVFLFFLACSSGKESSDMEKKEERTTSKAGSREGSRRKESGNELNIVGAEEWKDRSSDEIEILNMELSKSHSLQIEVRYSGGCKNHDFRLIAQNKQMKSNPPQRQAFLEHDAKGDACRSVIEDTLNFGIDTLKKPVILRFEQYEGMFRYGVE